MLPDETDEERQQKLPNDTSDTSPFAPPDDGNTAVNDTHQLLDNATDIQAQEIYDQGLPETEDSRQNSAVESYNPDHDDRKTGGE